MPPPRRCDHDEVIALNAAGFSQREIADHFGINQSSVCELLHRYGVESAWKQGGPRRYKLDEEYFTVIDTPEKAYWLGFLAGGGHIIHGSTGLQVRLAAIDIGHLQMLADALGSDVVPKIGKDGAADVRFHSRHFAAGLIAHGITPRKTWTCRPWNAPEDLAPHYWRGLIDGDGTVYPDGEQIVCIGTHAMVEAFRSFAADICGTRTIPRRAPGCWRVQVQGRRQVHALLTVLYPEDSPGLARKKEIALAITAEPYAARRFKKPCRVEGCPNLAIARLLCKKHYQRWKNNGDPSVSLYKRDVIWMGGRMTCNFCAFSLRSTDPGSVILMREHLHREHDIQQFQPRPQRKH